MNREKSFWKILILILFLVDFRSAFSETYKSDSWQNIDSVPGKPEWFLTSIIKDQGKLWTSPFRIGTGSLLFLVGAVSGNKKAKQTGLIALQTWFHTGFIVQVGKLIFGRQRPSYENGEDRWHGFPESLQRFKGGPVSKYDAFPSGHTIEAFGLATVIAEQYKDIKIIPVISYAIAAGAGLSRITEDTHWLSDVLLGAAMGYRIGKFMVRERKDTKWTLLPVRHKDDVILTAIYSF